MTSSHIEVWINSEDLMKFSRRELVKIFLQPSPTRTKVLLSSDLFQSYMMYTNSNTTTEASKSEKKLLKD